MLWSGPFCGRVSPRHVQSVQGLPDTRLVAVTDVIEPRAQRYARETGAVAYTDYRRMLERTDIDVVTICTPSGLRMGTTACANVVGSNGA